MLGELGDVRQGLKVLEVLGTCTLPQLNRIEYKLVGKTEWRTDRRQEF